MRFLKKIFLYLSIVFACSLTFIIASINYKYENIDFDAVIFHIFMPKKDAANDWISLSFKDFALIFVISFIIFISYIKIKKIRKLLVACLVSLLFFDIYYANKIFSLPQYLINRLVASDFIEKEYVDPKKTDITFPSKKQNLIFIQVESLEVSMQDIANGGLADINYIPELTSLAKKNINFSSSDKVGGAIVLPETCWTMGALVAETAGIPLKSYKIHQKADQVGNRFNEYKAFLTKVVSMGDILASAGYKNYFILGSSKYFAGQNIYMQNHGNHEIYDYDYIKDNMNVDKPNKDWWGLLDEDVYTFSKKKLLEISKRAEPFSVVIQTIDSHIDGYLNPKCSSKHDTHIKNVYSCVSLKLNEFITWISQQDFYPNTTIVVVGDHNNMKRGLFNTTINFKTGYYEGTQRGVYNTFINSCAKPKQEKNRLFSTMDIFPTTLSAMGIKIQGNRLGLGTDLFSEEKTLLEKYDYDYLAEELRKKSNFYNHTLLFPD